MFLQTERERVFAHELHVSERIHNQVVHQENQRKRENEQMIEDYFEATREQSRRPAVIPPRVSGY